MLGGLWPAARAMVRTERTFVPTGAAAQHWTRATPPSGKRWKNGDTWNLGEGRTGPRPQWTPSPGATWSGSWARRSEETSDLVPVRVKRTKEVPKLPARKAPERVVPGVYGERRQRGSRD